MNLYEKKLNNGFFWVQKNKPENVKILKQCHSHKIVSIESEDKDADGFIWQNTIIKNNIIGIYTADCLPILIEGKLGGVFLHAGWRGIHKKIHLNEVIDSIHPIAALIGPSIQSKSFEVTQEFYDLFPSSKSFHTSDKKIYFNLQAQVKEDLIKRWPSMTIKDDKVDTFSNIEFHSYRRTGKTDRNYNLYQIY